MKYQHTATCVAALLITTSACWSADSGSNLGNVRGGDFKEARGIISKKCTTCHSATRIDAALAAKKDMVKIQQAMETKGLKLNTKEREVLGIYWKQNPLKQSK
ncbi:cytochrome C [Pelotalea chapellei]|uniref:Cytochrome C n=1 Tax=Pelotalea chapellei TaxID=44671 RepID=A0ABS5U6T3_9BACT|nr:cytochrome C [Pelotalea chapellei]MBT1071377.1 cytochrome C [Pelotalea chapellei]